MTRDTYSVETLMVLIKRAMENPLSMADQDFVGNIYKQLCEEDPSLSEKQFEYLRKLTRKPTSESVRIRLNMARSSVSA